MIKGELLGYIGEPCPNCGRLRVERWTCGKDICEKCNWCIQDDDYFFEDEPQHYMESEDTE